MIQSSNQGWLLDVLWRYSLGKLDCNSHFWELSNNCFVVDMFVALVVDSCCIVVVELVGKQVEVGIVALVRSIGFVGQVLGICVVLELELDGIVVGLVGLGRLWRLWMKLDGRRVWNCNEYLHRFLDLLCIDHHLLHLDLRLGIVSFQELVVEHWCQFLMRWIKNK